MKAATNPAFGSFSNPITRRSRSKNKHYQQKRILQTDMAKNSKSIEEQVEDWCKKQFKGQKYYTKTEAVNAEIASALEKAPSKQGGAGKNFPDLKCLLTADDGKRIPVMIEVKGRKGYLIKTSESGEVDNFNKKGEPNYQNIAKYAVNGAVHYAYAILNYTETYKEVVAIGVNGYAQTGGGNC